MVQPPHDRRHRPSMEAIIESPSNTASNTALDAVPTEAEREPKPARHDRSSGSNPPLLPPQQRHHHNPRTLAADQKAERRLLWKLDLLILPLLLVVFMVSFLDRISMSNAKAMGLMQDLSLTVKKYNIAYFVCTQCPSISR